MRRKKSYRLTKKPMLHTAIRILKSEHDRALEAATKLEISMAEFFRAAVREKTIRVLDGDSVQQL